MGKEQTAVDRLRSASEMSLAFYGKPLVVTTSGGKDSSVCVELARRSKIPFEVVHNHTTADAPETVRFVRSEMDRLRGIGIECYVDYPMYKGKRTSMWELIPIVRMPPTRWLRYCCNILKEHGLKNRFIVTGVRWDESRKRRTNRGIYENLANNKSNKIILQNDNDDTRRLFESCSLKGKRVCNPIIDWTDKDVWDFLKEAKIPVNPLYQEGWTRVGCVGCPLANKRFRKLEFARWPAYKNLYLAAFDRMISARGTKNMKRSFETPSWETPMEVYHWWMEDGVLPGQLEWDEINEGEYN